MHFVIINFAFLSKSIMTAIFERDGLWKSGDLTGLQRESEEGKTVKEFFIGLGVTPARAREIIPGISLALNTGKKNDPRLKSLSGWEDVTTLLLPLGPSNLQSLANFLNSEIVLLGTTLYCDQPLEYYGALKPDHTRKRYLRRIIEDAMSACYSQVVFHG